MTVYRWTLCAGALVAATVSPLAVVAAVGRGAPSDEEGQGICDTLGCKSGNDKCADGTISYPDGVKITYTCYSKVAAT